MSFIKKLTQQLPNWAPSLAGYGGAAGAILVFFTDWRLVTDYIPIYNTKYSTDKE
ncbi:cytochrome b-c1 complex subunit 10-like [Thrips palmi]|uniref:Cytochrome b-c1 complex subunit 10-like n=1 Tax=Thrips palmi TaxID=161013 RepID=A0A6P8YMJ0_THRPL|nr:cytochrome b-c1 complex subunit 10-like [Thrips palmi]